MTMHNAASKIKERCAPHNRARTLCTGEGGTTYSSVFAWPAAAAAAASRAIAAPAPAAPPTAAAPPSLLSSMPISLSHRSASRAAMAPVPALVTACRYLGKQSGEKHQIDS